VGLEGEDAFFHCFFRYQMVHQNGAILSEAMCTISRLLLDSGIPPRIEQEDMVGSSEVEPEPTSAEGYEHHWRALRVLETVYNSSAIPCRSVQSDKIQPCWLQMWLDTIKEGSPL
jgi:hypothetical protein